LNNNTNDSTITNVEKRIVRPFFIKNDLEFSRIGMPITILEFFYAQCITR